MYWNADFVTYTEKTFSRYTLFFVERVHIMLSQEFSKTSPEDKSFLLKEWTFLLPTPNNYNSIICLKKMKPSSTKINLKNETERRQ